MVEQLLDRLRSRYHGLIPEENRNEMYLRSPIPVQWVWDRLGKNPDLPENLELSENDVLFSIRIFWFHEPSAELVQRWYTHAIRFNLGFNGIVHNIQYSSEALDYESVLKNSRVPDDPAYINYAYRILLRRSPTEQECKTWLEKIREMDWTLATFVSSFENSDEYRQRLKAEAEPHLIELNRFKMYVRLGDYFICAGIATQNDYEPHVSNLLDKIVRKGDYVIDVGANVGYHALNLATIVGERGKVFAFEPLPGNNELIGLGIEENGFTNLELFPYAAGDAAGELELLAQGNHTNARLFTNPENDNLTAKRYLVKVIRIDDLLGDLPQLRFVKIDAEGAEPMVVAGMSKLIALHRPILLFEFFPDFISMVSRIEPEQFLDQVIDLGYRLYVIEEPPQLTEVSDSAQAMRMCEESGHYMMDMLALPVEMEDFPVASGDTTL